ncbi:tetratricopeptide repeat protein [Blastopirellula marina]|uniref:Uncharacterized protein n=1 Tax=Blastopirellula marina TaxID=124 RepID=A0A2S8GCH4_9BACT|nr:tetratricopeptide repeat protein [Blastopirellula marina]PQO42147.1 hypothetical protein C5Y93_27765 [Blastopirellula marina]
MNYRVVPSIVTLATCMALVSGCATGGIGQGSMFAQKSTSNEEAFAQEISMARLAERHGNHASAKKIYRHVLNQEPENRVALHRMGVVAGKEGQYVEAVGYLKQAAAVSEPSAEILSDLGYVYYLQDNQALAQQYLEQSLAADPDYAAARTNLAIVYAENGDYDRALQNFRAISDEAEALSNLAYIQSQRGDIELAEKHYSRALDIDKNLRPAAEALVQIAQLKGDIQTRPNVSPESLSPMQPPEMVAEVQETPAFQSAIPTAQQFVLSDMPAPKPVQPAPVTPAPVVKAQPTVAPVVEAPAALTQSTTTPSTNVPNTVMASTNPLRGGTAGIPALPTGTEAKETPTVQQAQYQGDAPAEATQATSIEPSKGLTIPNQNWRSTPTVLDFGDHQATGSVQRPPLASSEIGTVQSASAESFSKQVFGALQAAASK